jgi:hypothetical protein
MVEIEVPISVDPFALMSLAGVPDGCWWFVTSATHYTCSIPEEYADQVTVTLRAV